MNQLSFLIGGTRVGAVDIPEEVYREGCRLVVQLCGGTYFGTVKLVDFSIQRRCYDVSFVRMCRVCFS